MTSVSVLVVDDDTAALAYIRDVLGAAGYAVTEAVCGARALRQIAANPPHVLITDMLMPDGDGVELITAVRCAYPAIHVIAVSECRFLCSLDLLDLARKLGADATFEKPLDAGRLLAKVASLTGVEVRPARANDQAVPQGSCGPGLRRSQSC